MPVYAGSQLISPLIFDGSGGRLLQSDYNIQPTIQTNNDPLEIEWDEYAAPFVVEGQTYQGVKVIKVRRVGAWIDSKITSDNIREGITIFGISGNVKELVPQANVNVRSTTSTQTVKPSSGYNGIQQVTVEPISLQTITGVNPSGSSQTITKSYGYDGINSVQINPVSASVDSNIKPENIKKNVYILGVKGEYDNSRDPVVQSLDVTPSTSAQTINVPTGVDGFNRVNVAAVTSDIDQNIKASNIKRGVSILGIEGNYVIQNLQSKSVTPSKSQLDITFDDGYEGLSNVIIAGVTSSIDSNIKPENIKKDVEILGVTGELEEGIQDGDIQDPVTVSPTTSGVTVRPEGDYKALSQVTVEGVTASIDPNILAENIKKNISILNVLGTYEGGNHFQTDKEVTPSTVDQNITNDAGYDALLNVIVKAVTASIDPNILPKNIRNNIQILGVTGTYQGGNSEWFDFDNISGIGLVSKNFDGGGTKKSDIDIEENEYVLQKLYDKPEGAVPENINAALFNVVYGYDNEEMIDPIIYQSYIYFIDGNFYDSKFKLIKIPDQISYMYPYTNDWNINGCLLNDDDTGLEKTYKLYVMTDSTYEQDPKPVLVDGELSPNMYPIITKPNIMIVGSPNISNEGILTDLSNVNYLVTKNNFNTGNYSWEIKTKVKIGSNVTSELSFFDNPTDQVGFRIGLAGTVKDRWQILVSKGTSWINTSAHYGSYTVLANTVYWIKAGFDGINTYYLDYSLDGINYTRDVTYTSNEKLGGNIPAYIRGTAVEYMDLSETYIKVNDEIWWQYTISDVPMFDGHRYVRDIVTPAHVRFMPRQLENVDIDEGYNTEWILRDRKGVEHKVNVNSGDQPLTLDVSAWDSDYGEEETFTPEETVLRKGTYNKVGSPTIGTNTISNFSSSNYLTLPNTYRIFNSEMVISFTTGSNVSSTQDLVWCDYWTTLRIESSRFYTHSWYNGWYNWFSNVQPNTRYWVKMRFVSGHKYCSYSTDGINYTSEYDVPDNSMSNSSNYTWYIGCANGYPFQGVLNLEGTYIYDKTAKDYILIGYKKISYTSSNHDIIPLTRNLLFYDIDSLASPDFNYHGNLVNYIDEGTAITIPLYRTHYHNDNQYVVEDFVQPILSSNGTMGGTTFAVAASSTNNSDSPAWEAFDGYTDYNNNTNDRFRSASGYPHWLAFYNPDPLDVTKITIYNAGSNDSANAWQFQYSDDYSTWTTITSGTNTNSTAGGKWSFEVSNSGSHKYYRLYVTSSNSSGYLGICEMEIEAKIMTPKVDEDMYVFSPDDTFTDGVKFTNTEYVDTVNIPQHNLFTWDKNLKEWITYTLMDVDIEINDETEEFIIEETK